MRKKFKRIVPFVLVGVLASSFVMTNYDKAREVKAVVGVDDLAVAGLVTTLLLAYGYATTQYYNNTDGANALADEWEEEYNQARLTVINGGGGSDNGDDDDDKNKFEDTDGDGKITEKDIPPYSNFLTKNAVTLSANASLLLAPIVTKFICDSTGMFKNDNPSTLLDIKQSANSLLINNNIDVNSFSHSIESVLSWNKNNKNANRIYEAYYFNTGYFYKQTSGYIGYVIKPPYVHVVYNTDSTKGDNYAFLQEKTGLNGGTFNLDNYEYLHVNGEIFDSMNDDYLNNSRVDWVTPELQDTFDNKGNLELLPSFDPLASYSMASQQALQELLSNLASSSLAPAQQLDLVNKFITGLKTSETPEPSPNPDPSPEPNPNPDPSNPDNGDGDNSGDSDIDKGSFVRDLRNLFPFCIPFDLIDCIRLFNAEPQTPKIDFPIHFPIVNVDYTFTIDLKDFDGVAKICRSMFLIMFIIGLVFATRPLIRG